MQFNLDNRSSIPNIQKTLSVLSKVMKRNKVTHKIDQGPGRPKKRVIKSEQLVLLDKPLIIQSRPQFPIHPAPYFLGNPIDFVKDIDMFQKKYDNFMFVIIANKFTPSTAKFESHMLMGLWDGREKVFYIIDPNGNDVTRDSIYSGRGFNFPRVGNLRNPLYNTMVALLKPFGYKLRFYTGDPLICPRGSPANCTYRTVMIMLGLMKSPTLNIKNSLETANFLTSERFSDVKTLTMKAFTNDENIKTFLKNLMNTFSRRNIQNRFNSV